MTNKLDGARFLWVRFGAFGDVLQAASDAFLVKKRFPAIKMSFLTKPLYRDILESQPYIDEVIFGEKKPLSALLSTARLLREKKYDWIGSTFQGGHMALLSLLGGVKNRLGCSRYFQFLNTQNIYKWTEEHGFSLYDRTTPSIFATKENLAKAEELLSNLPGKKIFAVIGSSGQHKVLPPENWEKIMLPLLDDGWGFVLNGHGELEGKMGERILELTKKSQNSRNVLNLVGKLNFLEMAGVAHSCSVAVGNDSGPLHLAALGGVPTLGIFDYEQTRDVGYLMPWFRTVTAYDQQLGNRKNRHRKQSSLATIPAKKILEKFYELWNS